METKQTAVEWLIQRIVGHTTLPIETINELILKSISMEKEQIIDACHHGVDYDKSPYLNAKEYYNGTYGK
jgi:hypothetical protein